jgi:hypothetical protein
MEQNRFERNTFKRISQRFHRLKKTQERMEIEGQ